jgi:hypothetical protein
MCLKIHWFRTISGLQVRRWIKDWFWMMKLNGLFKKLMLNRTCSHRNRSSKGSAVLFTWERTSNLRKDQNMKNISTFQQFLTFNSETLSLFLSSAQESIHFPNDNNILEMTVANSPNKNKIKYKELNSPSDLLRLWFVN